MSLKFYIVNDEYINFMKKFDAKIPNMKYGENRKPALGIVFNNNGIDYFVPVSSPKQKHNQMKDAIDFIKIEDSNKIYGVINLNNMVPIPKDEFEVIDVNSVDKLRNFGTAREKAQYLTLLNAELEILNKKESRILNSAKRLYSIYDVAGNEHIRNRCCDFKTLESKCLEYEQLKEIAQEQKMHYMKTKSKDTEIEI